MPAIPLPNAKRQAAAAAASAVLGPEKKASPVTDADVPLAKPTELPAEPEVVDTKQADDVNPNVSAVGGQEATPSESEVSGGITHGTEQTANAHTYNMSVISVHAGNPSENGHSALETPPTPTSASVTNSNAKPPPVTGQEIVDPHEPVPHNGAGHKEHANYIPDQVAEMPSYYSLNQPALPEGSPQNVRPKPLPPISLVRYQMPPPFQPAQRPPPGLGSKRDIVRRPHPQSLNGPHGHQSHPSNGSGVHFGAYQSSDGSSPIPPHSGGIAPPPGMHFHGQPPYMPPATNGYPPLGYGPEMANGSGMEGYGRQNMGYGPPEGYPAYGHNYTPSTPHSFHDSQSSAPPDERELYQELPGGPAHHGHSNYRDDAQQQQMKDRMMMSQHVPQMSINAGSHHMSHGPDDADGFVEYMRQQFGSQALSDSALVLRYPDSREAPVRVPGHRLIFARSPRLNEIIRAQESGTVYVQDSPNDIRLDAESKWIRSDSFWMAVQRLYGLPLLAVPPPPPTNMDSYTQAGSMNAQLAFALSYAASGHLLGWESVIRRGCEIAAQLITWQTLDDVMEYALEGFMDRGSYENYKYDTGSKVLLHGVVNFVVNNLPATFTIREGVDNSRYRLLPVPAPPAPDNDMSVEESELAHGSQKSPLGRGHRHQLSSIQFGDLSLSEGVNGTAAETPRAQQAHPASHDTLTRVLLNIPFGFLRMILEAMGTSHVNRWGSATARSRVAKDIISARESRRNRVVEALLSGHEGVNAGVLQQLQTPEPRNLDRWGILGWQEEVIPMDGPGLSLARQWVPIRNVSEAGRAEFP